MSQSPSISDPMKFIVKAEYIPFAKTTSITMELERTTQIPLSFSRNLGDITLPAKGEDANSYTVHFDHPPSSVLILSCKLSDGENFSLVQVCHISKREALC